VRAPTPTPIPTAAAAAVTAADANEDAERKEARSGLIDIPEHSSLEARRTSKAYKIIRK
jgi:hypothetical protein